MLHIAIVEDDAETLSQTCSFLQDYAAERKITIKISQFHDGSEILQNYSPVYDIIFMDIEMPNMDGMEAAKRIRSQDDGVVLVFITNLVQYAIQGYSVRALDYVLKPVSYYTFSMKLDKAIEIVKRRTSGEVILHLPDGFVRLRTDEIYYVESQRGVLHYHTEQGVFSVRGTMQDTEAGLMAYHFVRCNYWYLVNLRFVTKVKQNIAVVAGDELQISRRTKNPFLAALTEYLGGGG